MQRAGAGNTGVGWFSLFSNTTGNFNTGVGAGALALNNTDNNTAVGAGALFLNTTGTDNTGVGANALVHPQLVVHGKNGEVTAVHYEQINNMLLNEFLKEHKKVEELTATVAQQQKGMEVLTAQLKEQAAQIQKVSAQLEVNKPAPQVVAKKR